MDAGGAVLPAIYGVWYHNSFTDSDWAVSWETMAALPGRE
jgi:hypothetical protein